MKIYFAGPLFSLAEQDFNRRLAAALRGVIPGSEIILPQERAPLLLSKPNGLALVFDDCLEMIQQCDAMIAVVDGPDADSGTCIELGYAYALRKHVIGVRTDFRGSEDRGVNLMVSHACGTLIVDTTADIDALAKKIGAALQAQ